jgi:hypothetical protein
MTMHNKLPKFTAESSLFHLTNYKNSSHQNIHENNLIIMTNTLTNDVNVKRDQSKKGHCVNDKPVTIEAFGIKQTCDQFRDFPWISLRANGDIEYGCGLCPF